MVNLKNKKHLFFDLDDTLWDFEKNSSLILKEIFVQFELGIKLQTSFINFYKEDAPNDTLNILIESWGTMLTSIYSICFMRMFNRYQILDNLDNLDDVKIISDEIVPLIILFQPIISSDRFSGFGYCKKLLGVIVKKLVEFSAKGVVQAVVAIHKFFPDMVSKDCYPSLKPEKNKVIVDYTESLLDNSKDLCIKTDWMNLKKIYNK